MKKSLSIVIIMLFVMTTVVFLTACSSDDGDKNPSIVGTWYVENTYDPGTDYETTEYAEITYKKDGTLTGYWKRTYKDGNVDTETDAGRYDIINDILRIWWDSEEEENLTEGPWTATFSINGNKMTTSENGGTVWTRK